MYAVVECGGTQVRVTEKQKLRIPRITATIGEKYRIEKILMVSNGQDIEIGHPVVAGAVVEATILAHPHGPKINGSRYVPKKDYRRRWGARNLFTELLINIVSHPTIKALPVEPKKIEPKKVIKKAAKPASAAGAPKAEAKKPVEKKTPEKKGK